MNHDKSIRQVWAGGGQWSERPERLLVVQSGRWRSASEVLVWLAAPRHKRLLILRGSVTATDTKDPLNVWESGRSIF